MKKSLKLNEEEDANKLNAYLIEKAQTIREDMLTMIFAAQSGHPGGSLSAADIVTALYFHFLRIDPLKPGETGPRSVHFVEGSYLPRMVCLSG